MNILTLNKEQEAKLLELCKIFLPKHKLSFDNDNGELGILDIDIHKWGHGQVTWLTGSIHWYQLCLTELLDKIMPDEVLHLNGSIDMTDKELALIIMTTDKAHHPVDYLYNFWQQNK